jgi:hypothetical protein
MKFFSCRGTCHIPSYEGYGRRDMHIPRHAISHDMHVPSYRGYELRDMACPSMPNPCREGICPFIKGRVITPNKWYQNMLNLLQQCATWFFYAIRHKIMSVWCLKSRFLEIVLRGHPLPDSTLNHSIRLNSYSLLLHMFVLPFCCLLLLVVLVFVEFVKFDFCGNFVFILYDMCYIYIFLCPWYMLVGICMSMVYACPGIWHIPNRTDMAYTHKNGDLHTSKKTKKKFKKIKKCFETILKFYNFSSSLLNNFQSPTSI